LFRRRKKMVQEMLIQTKDMLAFSIRFIARIIANFTVIKTE
jgi:hypothetical protein